MLSLKEVKVIESTIKDEWRGLPDPFRFDSPGERYCIAMPVPNITGQLHIGHALNLVLHDVIARHRRSRGFNVFFPPGTDHAGLAGQYAAEKRLAETGDGATRATMGRAAFSEYMRRWHAEMSERLTAQMRELAIDANYDHVVSTIDQRSTRVVTDMFVRAHAAGLVYRDLAVVNWCTTCCSCISDMEFGRKEYVAEQHHIRVTTNGGHIGRLVTIAPELMLGAVAVAITARHPDAAVLSGDSVRLPLVDRVVPIVVIPERDVGSERPKDSSFDSYLSLVVPGYNADDLDLARARALPVIEVHDASDRIAVEGRFQGLSPAECRAQIMSEIAARGDLIETRSYLHGAGLHLLCGGAVRPRVTPQWYLRRAPLAKLEGPVTEAGADALNHDAWKEGYGSWVHQMFDPRRFERQRWWEGACLAIVQGFSSNRDWVISRQNWWGPPIPAWICESCAEVTVSDGPAETCAHCGSTALKQEEGVIDNWFGSAFWSLCATRWDETDRWADLTVVGHDILYFWIPAANMLSLQLDGKRALREVLVHGLICDQQGRKMSKSLGNAVDLDQVLARHGTEVLRAAMLRLLNGREGEEWLRLDDDAFPVAERALLDLWNRLRTMAVQPLAPPVPGLAALRDGMEDLLMRNQPAAAYDQFCTFVHSSLRSDQRLDPEDAGTLIGLAELFHPLLAQDVRRCHRDLLDPVSSAAELGRRAPEATERSVRAAVPTSG